MTYSFLKYTLRMRQFQPINLWISMLAYGRIPSQYYIRMFSLVAHKYTYSAILS